MNKLIIKVKEIKGNCVVYKGGEKIVIDGPEIDLKETDKICVSCLCTNSSLRCGIKRRC